MLETVSNNPDKAREHAANMAIDDIEKKGFPLSIVIVIEKSGFSVAAPQQLQEIAEKVGCFLDTLGKQ